MTHARRDERAAVDWGTAGAPLAGENESGDAHVVAPFADGVLLAVIDGLGHGVEAAVAARAAAAILEEAPADPLTVLAERCHEALRRTRGVVMSLAVIDAQRSSMRWLGVGNVESVLVRGLRSGAPGREALTLRGGVVGYQLPPLRVADVPLSPGDTLIMATDGIRGGFVAALDGRGTPQDVADGIFRRFSRGSDDALVLVARYLGRGDEER
jgi:negative regulator of sigma-B (phosphoserine phosphatase)